MVQESGKQITYTYEEAFDKTFKYFNNELASKVWLDKYALRNYNNELMECIPTQMHQRIAKEFARIEKKKFKKPLLYDEIYNYIVDFSAIIPQGSPMFGIGNPYQYVTLSNCYVLNPPEDSYGGILNTDQQLVQVSKRRGGNGIDLSHLRPANSPTRNSSRTSTGIVSFAERYSNSVREVGQGGRRGALMLTLNVHHPQILDFITMKKNLTKITGANISVRVTDEFLKALENDEEYQLRWPIDNPKLISKIKASEVWNQIITSAWESAEPGVLFWDNILKESPADCYADWGFKTISTNPCGELPLCILDSCRLLVINLMACVKNAFSKPAGFCFDTLFKLAYIAQRLMDDMIDLELEAIDRIINKIVKDPEKEDLKKIELDLWKTVYAKCYQGRRTGTGLTALADAMAAIGIQYGSEESVYFTGEVYKTLKLGAYTASVDMAEELGPFPCFRADLEKDNPFLLRLKEDDAKLYERMQQFGRRNIALLTQAPVGTGSLLTLAGEFSNNQKLFGTSSGIEPCFEVMHERKKKLNPDEIKNTERHVDFSDASGDMWEIFKVFHPGFKLWLSKNPDETGPLNSPYHNACAKDINWANRVLIQAAAQKHIDHSISSTVNLPNDITVDEVKRIYVEAWKAGCKGMTVYRDGCRDGILTSEVKRIPKTEGFKRPKELVCDIYDISVKHNKYFIVVGLIENEPYEVFIMSQDRMPNLTWQESGKLVKIKRGHYKLLSDKDNVLFDNIVEFCSDEQEAVARMVSTGLRHGVDIQYIVHQLEKVNGDLQSFSKAVSRALKKYILDGTKVSGETCGSCSGTNIIRTEGCRQCKDCGWAKC